MTRGRHPPQDQRQTPLLRDTTGYGQQAGGTHPTGMHSCIVMFLKTAL